MLNYITAVLKNKPTDWLNLTTHRLDIFNEKLAKIEFIEQFELLFKKNDSSSKALSKLPTAYDYIRLGHPLSCILEWTIATLNQQQPENVISFSSSTIPILAILRKNLFENKQTKIVYTGELPASFDAEILKNIYGYQLELKQVKDIETIDKFDGSLVFISQQDEILTANSNPNIDFFINIYPRLGSVLLINGKQNASYISDIQHVRRRETIAMTPANCLIALKSIVAQAKFKIANPDIERF